MKYAQHRSQIRRRGSGEKSPLQNRYVLFGGLALLILVAFFLLRDKDSAPADERELTRALDEVVEEKTTEGTSETASASLFAMKVADETDVGTEEILATEQITLSFVGEGSEGSGIARRGASDERFTHAVVAELPAIDTTQYFYEGWLVKPGVTKFFSTGEMFPRADGKWALVWEVDVADAPSDVYEYAKVVITLEPRDSDPAPAPEHVLEGQFDY